MPPSQHPRRISLQDLKAKITKILGPGRASQYFGILGQFFSCKLSKAELDRQVLLTVEREYLCLHNQLIWAIWTNATANWASPPLDESRNSNLAQRKPLPTKAADHESSPQEPQSPGEAARANGGIIPVSPRKGRSGIRDRKAKEKQNVPAIHFKGEAFMLQEAPTDDGRGKCLEDGVIGSVDLAKRLEKAHNAAQQPDNDYYGAVVPVAKRPRLALINQTGLSTAESTDEKSPNVHSESTEEAAIDETCTIWAKTEVRAPLGIPFTVGSLGAAVKAPIVDKPLSLNYTLLGTRIEEECSDAADLPDVDSLQRRMEHIAILEGGLEGVSYESAVCLNHALDVHLKKLITSCIDLVQSRRTRDEQGSALSREKDAKWNESLSCVRLSPGLNGIWPYHPPSGSAPLEAGKGIENHYPPVTPIDFKVAMENEPQKLGENWPTLLERLSFRVFEQQDKKYLSGL
ncbi:hypothetical protein O6H91_13G024600 [Diphasiastrum complanatum]|uniref:Uncharacterized protein n=1 Tax=Diphasiastrum complanatum TaxID=34168 RepID=A0ACC2BT80_DIPCM|nr:hypothetical protein O6H91_13G024600 [Diphasiastrum complanatum]